MDTQLYDIGIIGLGTMGRNLALNMLDHGYRVAGMNPHKDKVEMLEKEAQGKPTQGFTAIQPFIQSLRSPKIVMLMVPAGPPVDSVIRELLPYLSQADIILDGGNSHFVDTDRRQQELTAKGIHLLGVGVSGGEAGARFGPSIMPGGPAEAYQRVRPILEAISAHVDGEPCVCYLGPGSGGHYVKMVHNGIEYALMELISETYALLKQGLGLNNDALHEIYQSWNQGNTAGYLMEITARIFLQPDDFGRNGRLIDKIQGVAKQKGTGMWASEDALAIRTPVPSIDLAVSMRDLTALDRSKAINLLKGPALEQPAHGTAKQKLTEQLQHAFYAAMIIVFSQGMMLLKTAMTAHGYRYSMAEIAKIWRGGCIIRTALLEKIRQAYYTDPNLSVLLADEFLAHELSMRQEDLRAIVSMAVANGIPANGFMSVLGFYDAFRQEWLPANLIQAQRDYFGAHTYERIDRAGTFHTDWEEYPASPESQKQGKAAIHG